LCHVNPTGTVEMANVLLSIACAVLTGLVYTLSVVTLALPMHWAAKANTTVSHKNMQILTAFYFVFNMGSVIPLCAATANGPVAVVVPVVIASQLLSNMIIQWSAGCLKYTKSMRVGTYVLVVAAVQLTVVGPRDAEQQQNPLELLSRPLAIGWLSLLVVIWIVALVSLKPLNKLGKDSIVKLLAYTAATSIPSALNNSLNKVISEVPWALMILCSIGYIFVGSGATLFQAWGNAELNNSLSVPTFSCTQVIANGLTGIFIWGDLQRTEHYLAYGMIYVLILLGIYMCAQIDLVALYTDDGDDPLAELRNALDADNQNKEDVTRALTNFIESSKDDTVEAEDMRQLCITVVKLLGPEGNTQPIRDWLGDAGTPMSRKSRVSLQSMTRSDLKLETYHQLK